MSSLYLFWFESLVNSYRCKTAEKRLLQLEEFESLVNSYRCKTFTPRSYIPKWFESLVNSDRCKTEFHGKLYSLKFSIDDEEIGKEPRYGYVRLSYSEIIKEELMSAISETGRKQKIKTEELLNIMLKDTSFKVFCNNIKNSANPYSTEGVFAFLLTNKILRRQ